MKPAWALATFRDADGVEHYLHIIEQSNGSNRMFFHCSRQRKWRYDGDEVPPGNMLRKDACVTCLWCLSDELRD